MIFRSLFIYFFLYAYYSAKGCFKVMCTKLINDPCAPPIMPNAYWVHPMESLGGPLLMPGFPAHSQWGTNAVVKRKGGMSKLE